MKKIIFEQVNKGVIGKHINMFTYILIACLLEISTSQFIFNNKKKYDQKIVEHKHILNLPKSYDLREKLGIIRNQHLPQFCGSCWAMAATSTIADRYMLKNKSLNIILSVQYLLELGIAGDCNGGESFEAFQVVKQFGIPDDSCNPYQAVNKEYSNLSNCSTCIALKKDEVMCVPVTEHKMWTIKDYGSVRGIKNMKHEIFVNGPISCAISATMKLELDYKGGVFMDCRSNPLNHAIEVVGWGETLDEKNNILPYWIVKNSWGKFWGEGGYFKVPTSEYARGRCSIGIEQACSFPVL